MKKILTLLLLFMTVAAQSQTPSKELLNTMTFIGLENEVKPGYGIRATFSNLKIIPVI